MCREPLELHAVARMASACAWLVLSIWNHGNAVSVVVQVLGGFRTKWLNADQSICLTMRLIGIKRNDDERTGEVENGQADI